MSTLTPCYEIVTYTVKEKHQADSARTVARDIVKHFPGFIDWVTFSGIDDPTKRVDLVLWQSQEEALAAAEIVENQPEFSSFRSSLSSVESMGHYTTPTGQTSSMPPKAGYGIEIGRFRIKSHASESEMRQRYDNMVESYLAHQPGWKSQHLVSLGNGVFIDLAFANSQHASEVICASWKGQALCEEFLELIEPLGLEFGSLY